MSATPRPWKTDPMGTDPVVFGPDDRRVAFTGSAYTDEIKTEHLDNMRLIVRAVNAYDDLVVACKAIVRHRESDGQPVGLRDADWSRVEDLALAALAKAEPDPTNPTSPPVPTEPAP